ncbi:MAG: hypothetical protein LBO82_02695 [Synergistaceae bacterium]|nr:hypothetical protein [Synergistaceae bacterium]
MAICTYHLPDDPEVLENLIKKANPAYNVPQERRPKTSGRAVWGSPLERG